MARNILDAIRLLSVIGDFNLCGITMDRNRDTTHFVKHNFKDEIIIPLIALTDNIDYLMCVGNKTIITRDDVVCDLVEHKEACIVEFENDIKRLYNLDAWSFLKRWYETNKGMDSLMFIKMRLKRK